MARNLFIVIFGVTIAFLLGNGYYKSFRSGVLTVKGRTSQRDKEPIRYWIGMTIGAFAFSRRGVRDCGYGVLGMREFVRKFKVATAKSVAAQFGFPFRDVILSEAVVQAERRILRGLSALHAGSPFEAFRLCRHLLRAGSRPAGDNAGLREDACEW